MEILLQHLDEIRCSVCGAEIQAARREQQHCSGEWNEHVEYRCGRTLRYSPNFRRVVEARRCPNDGVERERRGNVLAFHAAVLGMARDTPCADPEFKSRILYWLENCKPRF